LILSNYRGASPSYRAVRLYPTEQFSFPTNGKGDEAPIETVGLAAIHTAVAATPAPLIVAKSARKSGRGTAILLPIAHLQQLK
jgi:hypothetical protein